MGEDGASMPMAAPISATSSVSVRLKEALDNLWLLTKDDTPTFVVPNTVFGLCGSLAGSRLIAHDHGSFLAPLARLPWVFLFNWSNLLVFDLANQRLPESVQEDSLNKPWRPVPSGRMTSSQVRRSMLVTIPLVLAFNHYVLDVGTETAILYTLTWLYNDLKGGDEGWICRNVIIAVAFGVYNMGSMKVAATGSSTKITRDGYRWIVMVSGVILTTMHMQDLKDQVGDRARGRQTAPLVLGDRPARWTLVIPILVWTASCACFWRLHWLMFTPAAALGGYIAWRCMSMSGTKPDRRTWQLWCMWTVVLYIMPLLRRSEGEEMMTFEPRRSRIL